jgi:hypothetical protein
MNEIEKNNKCISFAIWYHTNISCGVVDMVVGNVIIIRKKKFDGKIYRSWFKRLCFVIRFVFFNRFWISCHVAKEKQVLLKKNAKKSGFLMGN